MEQGSFTPTVNQVQEFIEIAGDFSNPLELVREAVSNSFDAGANQLAISFSVEKEAGEDVLVISLKDDGKGMNDETIRSFFDLGNSSNRGREGTIGEKGHGTKVYFNSSKVKVVTVSNRIKITAEMNEPYRNLFSRKLPEVHYSKEDGIDEQDGTLITIRGYNNNRRERFKHEILKDYIGWFTKVGSFERLLGINDHANFKLLLKGLDRREHEGPEAITFGHVFPNESLKIADLFDKYMVEAPHYFCRRIVRRGQLPKHPDVDYELVFSIEGNKIKQSYNPMLRRTGYQAPSGAYTVQERYGLWLCKDFIPVQRANEWLGVRGTEFTRFHAFFNCQAFKLTANRGSINNTPSEYISDVEHVIRDLFDEITNRDEWRDMEWLEGQAESYRTAEREEKDFDYRIKKFHQTNFGIHENHELVEPNSEIGVFAMVTTLSALNESLFPFQILDYNTHSGVDAIAKSDHLTPVYQSKLFYIEFKFFLQSSINHAFKNIFSIVCWDTEVKHGDVVTDVVKESRRMVIVAPEKPGEHTAYFLENLRQNHRIEVFVLRDYLREKLGLEFRPRPAAAFIPR